MILIACGSYQFGLNQKKSDFSDVGETEKLEDQHSSLSSQEHWEKFQGFHETNRKGEITEQNQNLRAQVAGAKYGPHEYQRALFKDQLLYFHFPSQAVAEKAEVWLYVYTGEVKLEFENIDNPLLKKSLKVKSSPGVERTHLKLADMGVLGGSGDITTLKIFNENALAILDYEIHIF